MEWLVAQVLEPELQARFTPAQVTVAGRAVLKMLNLDYSSEHVNAILRTWFEELENDDGFKPAWEGFTDRGCKQSEFGLANGSKHGSRNVAGMLNALFGKQLGADRLQALLINADPYKSQW